MFFLRAMRIAGSPRRTRDRQRHAVSREPDSSEARSRPQIIEVPKSNYQITIQAFNCPVIFVTAFDEYTLNAFKVNGIDYLLKPIDEVDLCKAINKYQQFFPDEQNLQRNWKRISDDIFKPKGRYKQRFLIKSGNAFQYLNTNDIIYFFSEDGLSFAYNRGQKKMLLDDSLEKIADQLDPESFFKISRKHVVGIEHIHKVHPYLNNRLKVELKPKSNLDLIVSRERVKDFKAWLDR